jgi:2-polyprenyl-3-methyl-5-hydroxy-6-metoxy-1,4-benzoquinol methylase
MTIETGLPPPGWAPASLTTPEWWDGYWAGTSLPAQLNRSRSSFLDAIVTAFERHLPPDPGVSALEVGAAPGRFLAHLHQRFGYQVHGIESSSHGCELLLRNLALLGVPAQIHHADLFDPQLRVAPVDIVYSLGLIEHYDDLTAVVAAHLRFLRPGGVLIIGAPNLCGLNGRVRRALAPSVFDTHRAASTDLRRWRGFERALGLDPLFTGYVGGFEPFLGLERTGGGAWALWMALRALRRPLSSAAARPLRALNSRLWSGYVLGIYRSPERALPTGGR